MSSYTVILKVPGEWSNIYVADVDYSPSINQTSWDVHQVIVALAKQQYADRMRANGDLPRLSRVRVLLTAVGRLESMYFGFQIGVN